MYTVHSTCIHVLHFVRHVCIHYLSAYLQLCNQIVELWLFIFTIILEKIWQWQKIHWFAFKAESCQKVPNRIPKGRKTLLLSLRNSLVFLDQFFSASGVVRNNTCSKIVLFYLDFNYVIQKDSRFFYIYSVCSIKLEKWSYVRACPNEIV